ncbi:hypothetical protein MCHI_001182 [Candidatus Magnetoovum chiemensis]|nr:hypothetical protein MCHI_001182 [Candidatus Magnetoovum chiemensis]
MINSRAGYFMSQKKSCLRRSLTWGFNRSIIMMKIRKNILSSKRNALNSPSTLPSRRVMRSVSLPSILAISSLTLDISSLTLDISSLTLPNSSLTLPTSSFVARFSTPPICVSAKTRAIPFASDSVKPASFKLSTAFIVSNVNGINHYNLSFINFQLPSEHKYERGSVKVDTHGCTNNEKNTVISNDGNRENPHEVRKVYLTNFSGERELGYLMSQKKSCLRRSLTWGFNRSIIMMKIKKNILSSKRNALNSPSTLPSRRVMRSVSLLSVWLIRSLSLPSILAISSFVARCSTLVICVSAKILESPLACASLKPASFKLSTAFIVSNVNGINHYNLTFINFQLPMDRNVCAVIWMIIRNTMIKDRNQSPSLNHKNYRLDSRCYFMSHKTNCLMASSAVGLIMNIPNMRTITASLRFRFMALNSPVISVRSVFISPSNLVSRRLIRSLSLPSILAISSLTLATSSLTLAISSLTLAISSFVAISARILAISSLTLATSSFVARFSTPPICVSAKTRAIPFASDSVKPASFKLSTAFIVSNVNGINHYNLSFINFQPLTNLRVILLCAIWVQNCTQF